MTVTSIRLPDDLIQAIDQAADTERRTRSQMIRVLLEEALDARGKK